MRKKLFLVYFDTLVQHYMQLHQILLHLLCMFQIESRVKEMRKQSGKVVTNVVFASKVKETGQVQPDTV